MRRFVAGLISVCVLLFPMTGLAGDPQAKADVVGNNGFMWTGHVGLFAADGKILEVYSGKDAFSINGTCVHYGRTLDIFKKGGYWGARYDRTIPSYTLARIYDVFKRQGDSYKATYNLVLPSLRFRTSSTAAWVMNISGSYTLEKKTVTGDTVLRCDFTVAASYREAAGKDLANSSSFLPSSVYNRLPDAR